MKTAYFCILLMIALCAHARAQEPDATSITIATPQALVLKCEGTTGSSRITAWASDHPEQPAQLALTHPLDDDDDCRQAVWTTTPFGLHAASTLALVNPGRMGLNAKSEAFLIDKTTLSYAGNIPVSADKVNATQYRDYVLSDPGSVWENTYEIARGKFSVAQALRLMRDGTLCVDHSGHVQPTNPCAGKLLTAQPASPVCVEYHGNAGSLQPIDACSRLNAR